MDRPLSRRTFIGQVAAASGALVLPGSMWTNGRSQPVLIDGRVTVGGRGLGSVGVTDGISIVESDQAGRFSLTSNSSRPYVYISVPRGHHIPQNATGTAAFYRPLRGKKGRMTADFELEALDEPDERHAFVALADPQTQNSYEMALFHEETVPDVRATLQALGPQPVFGVSCGDIMFDDLSLYPDYERAVAGMGIPFFQVIGNHDLNFDGMTDGASAKTFRSRFGPTYYSFDRGEVHYVVLDDVFWNHKNYTGYLDELQLHWLAQDLGRVSEGSPVVVFIHIPALSTRYRRDGQDEPSSRVSITNRQALYDLLQPFDAHIVSGHTHENEHVFEGGVHEHILGAACGAWWSGPICHDGTPNGYAVFEVSGRDLRWRYKSTGMAPEHQMRVYPRGADPSAPDEFVANVWDWDPEWTVVWVEGGVRRGRMARRVGKDPLSVKLHQGAEHPDRRPWVEPAPSDHLFYAPVEAGSRDIVVEATNRWGETFAGRIADAEVN